jgi:hypothetical protein
LCTDASGLESCTLEFLLMPSRSWYDFALKIEMIRFLC